MDVKHAVAAFLRHLEKSGVKSSTVRWYRDTLGRYVRVCGQQDLRQVTPQDVDLYLKEVRAGYASAGSVSAFSRPVHRFWAWAARVYAIDNPALALPYPRTSAPGPRAAALADIQRMYAATGADSLAGVRDRALLAFLLDTGVRGPELRALRVVDLDLDGRMARVGVPARTVVFTRHTATLLLEWLVVRDDVDVLFYGSGTREALTQRGLSQLLRRLARRAGVQGAHHPGAFRQAFAQGYLQNGGDPATLALLLGQRDAPYRRGSEAEIVAQHEAFSPIRQLVALTTEAP